MVKKKRVISPFLTIYKPQITSMFSIMERISGIALIIGILVVIILTSLKDIMLTNYWYYTIMYWIYKSNGLMGIIISGLIITIIFKFYYHLIFGLRYLYWERTGGGVKKMKNNVGVRMELEEIYKSSYILLYISIGLTILTWIWIIV